ncbi:MAG TPA: tRNA preQ1(34) S-adenosylmethionine ribosyltransferase-isomerase QueA [Candidatus Eisenbacteria bacterium]|nr:tRNA preQ1(34) S-adenosylmethionine ribosyltransferase-isomerase QueA [Candidatus Eisenbacteria bacterium]
MNLYDYELPESAIAQEPLADRSASRLLVLHRWKGERAHRRFAELPEFLRAGDLLVVNETRVIPARLRAQRPGGGKAEIFLVRALADGRWMALVRPGGRLKPGVEVTLVDATENAAGRAIVEEEHADGMRAVRFPDADSKELLALVGEVPLPPYIRRAPNESDRERYQTVFARVPGAVAAPTAGLHLTEELLARLRRQGVGMAKLVLHVGPGTFRPVQVDDPRDHKLDAEWCSIPPETAIAVNAAKQRAGRVIAVGTTTTRALEAAGRSRLPLEPFEDFVDLFIHPPFEFKVVDALITNFHLPRSSLLLLVSAFAGREHVLDAYRDAVAQGYRFYSYGDAMFIA